jgi:hypothetical protein
MNKQRTSNALGIFAGIIFIAGMALSGYSILHYSKVKRQQAKNIAAAQRLNALQKQFTNLDSLTEPLDKLNYSNLPDPEKLVRNIFGTEIIDQVKQEIQPGAAGYVINLIDISLKNADLEKIPAFIRTMESMRPPIRLTSCTITASATTKAKANITLKLQRIQKK